MAAYTRLPIGGKVFVDVPVHKRLADAPIMEKLKELGFEVFDGDLQVAFDLLENGELVLLLQ
ncbi:MAG: hypothetical protein ACPGVB_16095, partial [Chitinophagales bacterium]